METIKLKQIEHLKVERKAPTQPPDNFKIPFFVKAIQWSFRNLGLVFPKFFGNLAWSLFQQPTSRAKHKTIDELIECADSFELNYLAHNIKYTAVICKNMQQATG